MNDDPGFAHFLAEMGRVPLLTASEERRLALRVQRGDLDAKERMIRANLRLVVHIARAYQREDHALTLADLVQEGTFGLVRAVEKFEPQRGLRFSTYATIWIRQSVSRAVTYKGRTIRLPVSVEQRLRTLRTTQRELAVELGRDPGEDELAAALDWSKEELRELHDAERRVISLQQPSGPENDTELGELLPDDAPSPPELAEAAMLGEEVRGMLDMLHPRERALLELRFGLNDETPLTYSEVARRLGLRRREAVRIEELALRRLRAAPPIAGLAAVA